jgi:hypothetical protein
MRYYGDKLRVGARYKRVYTEPKTPYQMLMRSDSIPDTTKKGLTELFESLNPFYLRRVQEEKLRAFYKALKGVTEEMEGNESSILSLDKHTGS